MVRLATSTEWADLFAHLSAHLLDAAARVLDRSADLHGPT
jgi:hypothetical protein